MKQVTHYILNTIRTESRSASWRFFLNVYNNRECIEGYMNSKFLIVVVCLLLTSCHQVSSVDEPISEDILIGVDGDLVGSDNTEPTAMAGYNQNVVTGTNVVLDGQFSSDYEDLAFDIALKYEWEQLSGPKVQLSTYDQEVATFMAPHVIKTQDLQFSLKVTDSGGLSSEDTVTVTVSPK